jgi:hypothetical protein
LAGGNLATLARHARHLADCSEGIDYLLQDKQGERSVEGSIGKRYRLCRACLKVGSMVRNCFACKRNVGRDRIDADHARGRAHRQQRGAQASCAATDIEDALSVFDSNK